MFPELEHLLALFIVDDLAGKIVGVQIDTSAAEMLEDSQADLAATFAELKTYETYTVAYNDLKAGAIDAIAIDVGVANNKIAEYGDEYYTVEEPFASEQYGICFRKADADMCAQVEEAYLQLVADGTYIALGEKYGLDTANLKLAAE